MSETITTRRIPHSSPTLEAEDACAVAEVVRSGTLVDGPRAAAFERKVAGTLRRRAAVAVTSGSAALHLALRAMGMGPGDQVAIPSFTCISVLQAVRRAGAEPLLVDCDPGTFHMDPDDLKRRLTPRTRAIVLVHTFGLPARAEPFLEVGPALIEDVATALGAVRDGETVGAKGGCAVCSFHATKIVTTGGGGAVAADDPALLEKVEDLVSYDARDDAAVRYNERIGEIGAALGLAQLSRLGVFLQRRRALARVYREMLRGSRLVVPAPEEGCEPAWHRFVVRVAGGAERARVKLVSLGIDSPPPVHRPLHQILGRGGFPGSETAHREALSLPIYPTLGGERARWIAGEVLQCIERCRT